MGTKHLKKFTTVFLLLWGQQFSQHLWVNVNITNHYNLHFLLLTEIVFQEYSHNFIY